MKWAILIVRVLVGLLFAVLGSDHFLHFMPQPAPPTETAGAFAGILFATNYMTVVKVLEIAGGILLLTGRMAPLGLILLVPVTVNIALWDLLLAKLQGPPLGLILLALEVFLIWGYRRHFTPLLTTDARVA